MSVSLYLKRYAKIGVYEVQNQRWADKMIDCLLDMKDAVDCAKEQGATSCRKDARRLQARYKRIVKQGFAENPLPQNTAQPPDGKPTRGPPKRTKAQNLLIRLRDHQKEVLAFLYDFRVPFDNNLAERDLRMVKGQQKISGTFRSKNGGSDFCRIRSYISTVRKHALNVIDAIHSVFAGAPLLPSLDSS